MTDYYFVEKIMGKKYVKEKKQVQYLIKWQGYPTSQNTWEPVSNLKTVLDMIKEFEADLKSKKEKRKRAECKSRLVTPIIKYNLPVMIKLKRIDGKYYIDDDDQSQTTKIYDVSNDQELERSQITSHLQIQSTNPIATLKSNPEREDNEQTDKIGQTFNNEEPKADEVKKGEQMIDAVHCQESPIEQDPLPKAQGPAIENQQLGQPQELDQSVKPNESQTDEQFESILSPKSKQNNQLKSSEKLNDSLGEVQKVFQKEDTEITPTIEKTKTGLVQNKDSLGQSLCQDSCKKQEDPDSQFLEFQIRYMIQSRLYIALSIYCQILIH